MPKKQSAPAHPRGGTDTLRERGLVSLSVLLSPEERDRLHAAARLEGKKTNAWLRELAVRIATETLGKRSE